MRIVFTIYSILFLFCFTTFAQPEITSLTSMQLLKEGNERYSNGQSTFPNVSLDRRNETKEKQKPFATVLACSDSRVPVDLIFDRGIGDIFSVKVAGNVAGVDELATIEYGLEHLKTPLLVVLGHTKCGAVTAVVNHAVLEGSLPLLAEKIIPASIKSKKSLPNASIDDLVFATIKQNTYQAIEDILKNSQIVRKEVKEGKCKIVAAIYDILSGKVEWIGPHPDEAKLLATVATITQHKKTEVIETQHTFMSRLKKMFSFSQDGDGFFTVFFIIICSAVSGLIIFGALFLKTKKAE